MDSQGAPDWREALDEAVKSLRAGNLCEWELYLIERRVESALQDGNLFAAQAYQVIGYLDECLYSEAIRPSPGEILRALDYFSAGKPDEDFLPWPIIPSAAQSGRGLG